MLMLENNKLIIVFLKHYVPTLRASVEKNNEKSL